MAVPTSRERLDRARELPELFDLVKTIVLHHLRLERAGLMLGLSNLGGGLGGLVGGFFQVGGNLIVMNQFPLHRLRDTNPALWKPFAFHILLHEYLHSVGYLSESEVRPMVLQLSEAEFGRDHPVTEFARGWEKFLPNLVFPGYGYRPAGGFAVEVVRGFDPGASTYIQ